MNFNQYISHILTDIFGKKSTIGTGVPIFGSYFKGIIRVEFYLDKFIGAGFAYWKVKEWDGI